MSAITYLTNIVTSLTNRFNLLESNSKKVDELPHQTTLEPTSKIPVSRAGNSEHLTVQQIISSIQNSNYNQLLAVGTITVDGTDIIIPSGVSGQINGALYGTSTDTTIPITLCPAGFNRKDILVLTTSNTVIAISGEETDGAIVIAPLVPLDAIYITEFDVNDTVIGTPGDPIVGTQFKKKNESQKFTQPLGGINAVINLQTYGQQYYVVVGPVTSIAGFSKALITASPTAEVPYAGKDFFFENKTDHDVTLKNAFSPVDIPFNLGADLVVPTKGIVWLKYNPNTEQMDLFFKSWSEDSSVLEFANLAAFPVTGETGIIYLALDTNKTYRWTGSAYVQLSSGIDFPSDGKTYGVKNGLPVEIQSQIFTINLGRFLATPTSTGVYTRQPPFAGFYNPTFSTGVSNHLLLSPNHFSVIGKVPFDCSLLDIVLTMSSVGDASFSIWKTAPNLYSGIPIELYHVDDTTDTPYKQFIINSDIILKDSFIHIFYTKRSSTSAYPTGGFLTFKRL